MDQITMDEWNTVLATNLTAPFVLCKKIIPIMEKQGAGTIVNVASMAATAAGRGGLLTLLPNMAFSDSPVRCHWIMDVQECV